jgi:hypothetical protein
METLYGRLQLAASQNQYDPWEPGRAVMEAPCVEDGTGRCTSRLNHRMGAPVTRIDNPAPETSEFIQTQRDYDVMAVGTSGRYPDSHPGGGGGSGRHAPPMDMVGTHTSDMSRGQMLLPSARDMPIVRRVLMLDSRTRDPAVYPTASQVVYQLEKPIFSVSRIEVQSVRVPIVLAPNGLIAEDYVMMSIGMGLEDVITPINKPDVVLAPALPAKPTFARAIAYLPLQPMNLGSAFAGMYPATVPHQWYTDFRTPISSIERIELSWWYFIKTVAGANAGLYTIPVAGAGTVGTAIENTYVTLEIYGKDRRPE